MTLHSTNGHFFSVYFSVSSPGTIFWVCLVFFLSGHSFSFVSLAFSVCVLSFLPPPYFFSTSLLPCPYPPLPGTLDMTNLAYDPDALDLEEEEDATEENQRTPKTSVSSVTTPPSTTKRIAFFKKVTARSPPHTCLPCAHGMPACVCRLFLPRIQGPRTEGKGEGYSGSPSEHVTCRMYVAWCIG